MGLIRYLCSVILFPINGQLRFVEHRETADALNYVLNVINENLAVR